MQSSDSEKVNRAGLLKRLLNVFRCFVPNAEDDPTDEIFYLGRLVEASAQRILHPCPRRLCRSQDRIAAAVADHCAALRITSEKHSTNITPRQISAHVELAGVARRPNKFCGTKKFQFIPKLRRAFPTNLPDRVRR